MDYTENPTGRPHGHCSASCTEEGQGLLPECILTTSHFSPFPGASKMKPEARLRPDPTRAPPPARPCHGDRHAGSLPGREARASGGRVLSRGPRRGPGLPSLAIPWTGLNVRPTKKRTGEHPELSRPRSLPGPRHSARGRVPRPAAPGAAARVS